MHIRHFTLLLSTLLVVLLTNIAALAADYPGVDGYEPMKVPADNPITPGKVLLGKQLFFDRRMSGDQSVSCTSCHLPRYGLTQGPKLSPGAYGIAVDVACPSLVNVGHQQQFFWEGSVPTLEGAVQGVWMFILLSQKPGAPKMMDIAARLNAIPSYRTAFRKEFGSEATPDVMVKAIASYLRTINSNGSAWMRFYRGHEQTALSAAGRRGHALFDGKAGCTNCHSGVLLTDLQFHNVGVGSKKEKGDPGRYVMTKVERDQGAFKTPTLLNISRTAPYFHDHSVKTLEAAVDQMLAGGIDNAHLDRANLKPVHLSPSERRDLLSFLRSLDTDTDLKTPKLP